jgi:DNA polymerase-1
LTEKENPLLLIVDMSALAFRSHFAMMRRPLKRADGMVTSALFGMSQSLLTAIKDFAPSHVLCALDAGGKSFRNELYSEYKAHRPPCPPELALQLDLQEELADAFGLAWAKHQGFEADDIIAAYTKLGQAKGWRVLIYSSDKDFMQLLDDKTEMLISLKGGDSEVLGANGVEDKLGVQPSQVADFLALMGDSADNVPGAPGVGKVTAAKLLGQFDSLKGILDNSEQIKKKGLAAKIKDNVEQIRLSRELVELRLDIPEMKADSELVFKGFEKHRLAPFVEKMAFPKVMSRAETMMNGADGVAPVSSIGEGVSSRWVETMGEITQAIAELPTDESVAFYWEDVGGELDSLAILWEGQSPLLYRSSLLKIEDRRALYASLAQRPLLCLNGKGFFDNSLDAGVPHGEVNDIFLMESVAHQTGRESSLGDLVGDLLSSRLQDFGKIGNKKKRFGDLSESESALHLVERVVAVHRLWKSLGESITERGLVAVYEQLERPLMDAVWSMERRGITLDVELLKDHGDACENELQGLTKSIHEISGEEFNIQSPKQLGVVLFEKMKLQDTLGLKKIKKTKTGYSTNASVLESLKDHPIGEKLLRFRFLSKLKSTYLDALPKQCSALGGRVHTTYYQNGTATGRLSSQNPNLQNIPMRVPEGARIRRAFIASDQDHLLLAADYSQIELRVLAHYSGDEVMVEAFRSGVDIHTATAAKVHLCSEDDVTREMRSSAKAVNFGLLYGMGPKLLSQQTQFSFSEAQKFIKAYFKTFPRVRGFMLEQVEQARKDGFVHTLSGRRRDLPDLNSSNGMLRSAAENMALNTPIQGSAADVIKWAMLRLHRRIEKERLPMKMLLQVHDELVFELHREHLDAMKEVIRFEMERVDLMPVKFSVPLEVEMGVGENWLEAH